MTLLRLIAFAGLAMAVVKAGEYAGAPPASYQRLALVVTLLALSIAHGRALAQARDEDGQP